MSCTAANIEHTSHTLKVYRKIKPASIAVIALFFSLFPLEDLLVHAFAVSVDGGRDKDHPYILGIALALFFKEPTHEGSF